jgi:hypothetical protein
MAYERNIESHLTVSAAVDRLRADQFTSGMRQPRTWIEMWRRRIVSIMDWLRENAIFWRDVKNKILLALSNCPVRSTI